jgi:hypothetical protein
MIIDLVERCARIERYHNLARRLLEGGMDARSRMQFTKSEKSTRKREGRERLQEV